MTKLLCITSTDVRNIYIYICIYIYMCVCVCVYVRACVRVCVCVCVCVISGLGDLYRGRKVSSRHCPELETPTL
jgi:hypothetical protein